MAEFETDWMVEEHEKKRLNAISRVLVTVGVSFAVVLSFVYYSASLSGQIQFLKAKKSMGWVSTDEKVFLVKLCHKNKDFPCMLEAASSIEKSKRRKLVAKYFPKRKKGRSF